MKPKIGDKQPDFGTIPSDWAVRRLSEHFKIYPGGDVPKSSLSQIQSKSHPYAIFANSLQRAGLYGYTSVSRSPAGCLTVTGRGYLGHAEYRDKPFFPIVRLLVLEPIGDLDPRFTTYSINDRVKFAFESTGVPQLTAPQLGKYSVASPSLSEQRIVAEALSDVDALLGALDRLIAKKRDLKQAAMQQLLTGQTRLAGFSGEPEVTTFSQVVRHHAGNSALIKGKLSSSSASSLYPAFSASGQDVWCEHFEHEGEAVVVSAVGSRCGKAFKAAGKWSAIANTHVVWPDRTKIDIRYLELFINDENFWLKSGTGQPFVLFKQTFSRPLLLPSITEQAAIADIVSDMDTELGVIRAHRAKTAAVKQGMMQELLTGRTRLV